MRTPHYHLAGIAVVGLSALAELLLARGARVSGSDRHHDQGKSVDALERLRAAGAEFFPQDGSGIAGPETVLVVSTAIENDNVELAAARAGGCRVAHRAELLAELANEHHLIAVTGTAGKTTVTGMIGWILESAGFDPTVINGGAVLAWRANARTGSVRIGRSDWWVVEADESDRSLLRFAPAWALVTNISADHFGLDELRTLFRQFAEQATEGVVCGPGVAAELRLARPRVPIIEIDSRPHVPLSLQVPGAHNLENARAAMTLCEQLGVDREAIRRGLESFRGIHRRLECTGQALGVTVYDDYAHNPAKIEAAWRAVSEKAERVFAVWRPHGFGPLAAMSGELAQALSRVCRPQDRLYLLPVYYAGGTATRTVTSDDFATRLRSGNLAASVVGDYAELRERLTAECRSGDVVLCMGARDPDLPLFAHELPRALAGTTPVG